MAAALTVAALLILWLACLYLLALGVAAIFAPARALRFLAAFAQTNRANLIESALRFLVGLAFVIAAPMLGHPSLVRWFGLFLAATALLFVAAPQLHRRFAAPAVARIAPFLTLIGLASILLSLWLAFYLYQSIGPGVPS